jgi:hypothetical protein
MKAALPKRITAAILLCLLGSAPALAITAQDVTQKMSKQDRFNYLTGLIDMRAYAAAQSGDAKMPKCIYDAYYRKIGDDSDAWVALYAALEKFPKEEPSAIVFLLTKKACS